ncbi:DUF6584 family protein [Streptomyces sp. NPDC048330]|uniref:DUF6584 family protein n=1 Tax=Streptomyces sp. NPDC048330 TaxID=3365533 RepID=UPI00371E6874
MPLSNTLARVDADLAAGRVPQARQRLRGLVSSFPDDLTLRRRLGEVYRLYGDAAQAGRWTYLEEDRRPEETEAFEERYRSPARRMKALAWRGPEERAATALAGQRLASLREARAEELGRPVDWDDPASYDDRGEYVAPDSGGWSLGGVIVTLGCLVGGGIFVAVWIIGVVTLFE